MAAQDYFSRSRKSRSRFLTRWWSAATVSSLSWVSLDLLVVSLASLLSARPALWPWFGISLAWMLGREVIHLIQEKPLRMSRSGDLALSRLLPGVVGTLGMSDKFIARFGPVLAWSREVCLFTARGVIWWTFMVWVCAGRVASYLRVPHASVDGSGEEIVILSATSCLGLALWLSGYLEWKRVRNRCRHALTWMAFEASRHHEG